MKLVLIYDTKELEESIKNLCIKYNTHLDSYKDKTPKAFKIKGYYGTKLVPFAVFLNTEIEIPFYSDNNGFSYEHIEEILNRYAE